MVTTSGEPGPFDLVVVGGGPAGYGAALYAASAGLAVAVVEKDKVGGTCLHRGCVPAKEFLETANVFRTVETAKEFGVTSGQPSIDFATTQARKQKVVDQLYRGLAGLMRSRGIETIAGTGRLDSASTVHLDDGTKLSGRGIFLATGSVPRTIAGFDIDGRLVMTSNEVLDLERLPASVAIIGGGAIGCELASMMADLGTQVTILEAMPTLLTGCDSDIIAIVTRMFKKKGIVVRTGVSVLGHEPNAEDSGTLVRLGTGEDVAVDAVVVSVGRAPATAGLVDEGSAVVVNGKGFVEVDGFMRTGADHVYAVGDIVDTPQLAHVGFAEAKVAVRDFLGENPVPVDYGRVPWCIYTHPEVAFAGMTEEAARAAGLDVVVKRDPFGGNSRARILGETDGMVKVVAERGTGGRAGRLLGVHMVGPLVTEQLGQGYLSVNWDATPEEVGDLIQPHPTLSEAFGEAVMALSGRGLHVA